MDDDLKAALATLAEIAPADTDGALATFQDRLKALETNWDEHQRILEMAAHAVGEPVEEPPSPRQPPSLERRAASKGIPTFWDALPGSGRKAVEEASTSILIRQGAFLMREHNRSSQVYVLLAGAVKVWAEQDGEIVILDVLGPGDLVGELEAVDGGTRQANVEALTPVQAIVLPADRFRTVLNADPEWVWAVAAVLAERLRDANELRIAHFPNDAERRLGTRLLRLFARFGTPAPEGDGTVVDLPVSQQDLGRWAGVGRRKVAQILADDRVRGSLSISRKSVGLRSLAVLDRLARRT
ncbi:Crp/Fnr family transcriptional regulator [Actinomadura fulvescens]|uniref:Cyclic nucleotide-binding domain-containing protein n=1 Tax=Actinomadura fulvescens TaxID=46160 RepID=A0ABP6CPM1_9ACTN